MYLTAVRCAAHTLQVGINAVLKDHEIEKVTTKAWSIVKKLRTPNINILLKTQELKQRIIGCPTSWSSTFDMLSSLNDTQMKAFCFNLVQANTHFILNDQTWVKIKGAVVALQPANVATKILQKSYSPSAMRRSMVDMQNWIIKWAT